MDPLEALCPRRGVTGLDQIRRSSRSIGIPGSGGEEQRHGCQHGERGRVPSRYAPSSSRRCRLNTARGKPLYDYWGTQISEALNTQAKTLGSDTLINCASQEYFGAVDRAALHLRVVTPVFMEDKAGTPKIVSFYAKRARGAMARFIIQHRLTDPDALLDFDSGGYRHDASLSKPDQPVFLRDHPTA